MTTDDALVTLEAGFSPQERQFVHSLASNQEWDLAAAARAAGYEGPSPAEFAGRLMRSDKVRRALALIQTDRRARYKDVRDGAIQALWMLATYDIKDLAREGELLAPDQLPASVRCAIKGIKKNKQGEWEYMLVDRTVVLGMLLKHFELGDQKESLSSATAEGVTVVFETPSGPG